MLIVLPQVGCVMAKLTRAEVELRANNDWNYSSDSYFVGVLARALLVMDDALEQTIRLLRVVDRQLDYSRYDH